MLVVSAAVTAMLVFAAATQGWFLTRSRWYESVVMLLVTFTLLRPDFWMDFAYPKYDVAPAADNSWSSSRARRRTPGLRVRIEGTTVEGKEVNKTVLLPLGSEGSACAAPEPRRA